ncbi:transglycosylase domain-containing protein [Butyricimonas synergistica]|uniref:transglycosylase domain-containing protein n=1 Tax=Butyricimonas synergistica TaxID=544644 RepID=UPI00036099A0|nr:transglycosylase domain-containing protein [Butyricimonas synergistica]
MQILKKYWKDFAIFWGLFVIFVGGIFFFFYLVSDGKLGFMPTFEELENPNNNFATEVYSADGKIIGKYFEGSENRRYMEYKDIPQSVIDALIATEDVRFYNHSGIDVRGLFRVAKGMVTGDAAAGGGSTVTQQLAKMLFPREANQNFVELAMRKFREWVIAVKLEKSYTKEEIITMYLNKFDFLNLAVGINSAANIYFSTSPDSLRVEQAAMLVGMAKNPSLFNPVRRPDKTLGRRNVVLSQMLKYDKISETEFDSLKNLPLGLDFHKEDHKEGIATYFREYMRLYLTANKPERSNYKWNKDQYAVDSLAWEKDPLYGWCNKNLKSDGSRYNIYTDGLKIYTTLDSRMQKYAEEAMAEHLGGTLQPAFMAERRHKANPPFSNDLSKDVVNEILNTSIRRTERYRSMNKAGKSFAEIKREFEKPIAMSVFTWNGVRDTMMSPLDSLKHYKSFFRAGFMAMEPATGHIKAYVGGPNYHYFQYDMVSTGKRQIGSTIKPILYTLAMQEGLGPCDKVLNVQQTFVLPDGTTWTPRNSTSKREGEMVTLKWGLANSVNNISGWVLKQFTPEAVVQMAHKMGITSYIDPVPAIFLGSSEVSVKEMVSAFSVYANKGVYNSPTMVTKIEDKYGNLLATFHPESREVITENTAYLMANLLKGVVKDGTGVRLRYRYQLMNPIGGKTGTTQNHSDGWFIGITPDLAGGVWVGAEDRSIHFQNLANGQGASMALPIWALFMQKVYADKSLAVPQRDFERPNGVTKVIDCDDEEGDGVVEETDTSEEYFD